MTYRTVLDDIDFWGVVSHHKWVAIFERFRTQVFSAPFREMLAQKTCLVVAELKMKYRKPARFDETITIEIVGRASGRAALVVHHTAREAAGDVLAEGDVHLVYVNERGRPQAIPDWARTAMGVPLEE